MIRILIGDDHAVVREGVKRILDETSDLMVAGEASHGQEVLAKVAAEAWDVVLLDISMPGRNGLEVLQQLRALHPSLPVLVFSMHPEDQYAVRAFRAGAAGYLTKDSLPEELISAIRKVMGGDAMSVPRWPSTSSWTSDAMLQHRSMPRSPIVSIKCCPCWPLARR